MSGRVGATGVGLMAMLLATPVCASDPADGVELEEVVVTARKRQDLLRETPLAVTVIPARSLEVMAATQLRDLAATVPGLGITTSGMGKAQVSLRGITAGGEVSPTVGIYVDEVPYGSSTPFAGSAQLVLEMGLADLARIEVLRGPQGTLYGASSMGGLIKYVPRAPDPAAFGGFTRAGVSRTRHGGTSHELASTLNLPLGGATALRVGGFHARDGGYVDDLQLGQRRVDGADMFGGRAELLWNASRSSLRLVAYAQGIDRDGSIAADRDLATGDPIDGPLDKRGALTEPFDQDFSLFSGTARYDLEFAELVSVTSWQRSTVDNRSDASDLYVPLLAGAGLDASAVALDKQFATDRFTQELRLAASGTTLDWLVGAYYTRESSDQHQHIVLLDDVGQLQPVDVATIALPSAYQEVAGFSTLTWHATARLDLTGGLRLATSRIRQEQIASGLLAESVPERSSTENVATFLSGLRFRASDQLMGYLRIASGYRPGGPNIVANDPGTGLPIADPDFAADSLISHEAGLKYTSADRRYGLDVALYHIDWKDLQIVAVRNGVGVIDNAASARSRGIELTMTARPVSRLTLVAALAGMDAELDKDSPDLGGEAGDRLPRTPRFMASLSAEQGFSVLGREAWVGAALRHVGRRDNGFALSPGQPPYRLPAYELLDLRGGLNLAGARLLVYVRNVTNRSGQLSASTESTVVGAPARVSMVQPRTFGLQFVQDFQ